MEKPISLSQLQPKSRYGVIFGLYLCLFLLINSVLLATHRAVRGVNVLPLAFLFCMWLFGLLIVLLDRPGPVRNWAGPFLLSLCCPYVAFWYDSEAALYWVLLSRTPAWPQLLTINVLLLGGFAVYFRRMYPKCCPNCSRRSLIPLLRLTRTEKRLARTRWCASCGETHWGDAEGNWHKERRRTWVDEGAGEPCEAAGGQA